MSRDHIKLQVLRHRLHRQSRRRASSRCRPTRRAADAVLGRDHQRPRDFRQTWPERPRIRGLVRGFRADDHRLAPSSHSSRVPNHGRAADARGVAASIPTMIGTGSRIISVNLPTVPSASSGPSPGLHTGAGREPGAADCPACVPRVRQSVPWGWISAGREPVARLASNLRLTRRRRVRR